MQRTVKFQLIPNDQLKEVDGFHGKRWEATGNDGHFYLVPDGGYPFPGGWYRLDLKLTQKRGRLANTTLYPDYGAGALETLTVKLPLVSVGGDSCIVRFTANLAALRLDPSVAVCEFEIEGMTLRRITKSQALVGMMAGIVRSRHGFWMRARAFGRAAERLLRSGVGGLGGWLYDAYSQVDDAPSDYKEWIRLYEQDYPQLDRPAAERVSALPRRPVFSVVVPVYNTDERWLRACIDSVISQHYSDWELCIANDASTDPRVRVVLDEYQRKDHRIRVVHRSENGHISAASNSALELASGEYVALLDHDDELHPMALLSMAEAVNRHPGWRMLYSDEDKIDTKGCRFEPYFKADYNYDLFLAQNSICHLGVYETALIREVGGFRLGLEGSQDWDLALRCVEKLRADEIGHVPEILYHWRAIPGSTALSADQKNYAHDSGLRAVADHVAKVAPGASVLPIERHAGHYRVQYPLPAPVPKVSLIVPTRDKLELLRVCVSSILDITKYEDFEILIVDNGSEERATLDYFAEIVSDKRVRVLPYPHAFNYSAINNFAVEHTDAEVIGLVNNDIEAISSDWLTEMVSQAVRPLIGAVGALLYYPDDTVQHGGVVTGIGGVAGHVHHGLPRGSSGYFSRMALVQNLSCVTAACLVIRREVYRQVGGLDEGLKVAFNDVDFCLRVRDAGYRNLWTPFAELYHHESASRGYEDTPEKVARFQAECNFMFKRWGESLDADPAYNPNLTLTAAAYQLAFPPRRQPQT
ncbi:MAG: glycosyltransferase family 2 protein [Luteibacter sp.]|uniref:glycosyltransferase family 2 protein n=1 Tax=Luteibacter sp. TaxID=1886636 RepID=UPI002806ADB2|nr:glycosyltransferase family 2 protein [Luteibacter sp.]MDQ7996431.1 glycosyltransferase family 2 protein [Luteibacter sp.]MDQ8047941.1 glycosyltransferase family 2 protein [Luteibacter sp.]